MTIEVLRCEQCGDVIGVYEPAVVRIGDQLRETSRAADRLGFRAVTVLQDGIARTIEAYIATRGSGM